MRYKRTRLSTDWIKEELIVDYQIDKCRTREAVKTALEQYVCFYNEQRPCFAIGYDTPVNYRKRDYKGELGQRDSFSRQKLSELPKYAQAKINGVDN